MNEGIQTSKWSDQACRQEAAEMHPESEAHKNPRELEQKRQGVAVEHPEPKGQMNPWEQRPKMPI